MTVEDNLRKIWDMLNEIYEENYDIRDEKWMKIIQNVGEDVTKCLIALKDGN